jgi:ferredoxin
MHLQGGGAVGLGRFQFASCRMKWHDRLKWVKYAVFFGLLAVSMFSMGLAEKLAEVEPFKTTFLVGVFNRSWPYTLFAAGLLGLSIFIERPFCKYLCPLGASLAMPRPSAGSACKRKQDCNSCKACAVGCGSQAIDADGRIDHRECLHCLDCMVLYTDVKGCPPLAKERKRRDQGRPGAHAHRQANGYFIPIHPVAPALRPDQRQGREWPRPTHAYRTCGTRHKAGESRLRWIMLEVRDHLWPWSTEGWHSQRALQVAGFSLAVAATWPGSWRPWAHVLGRHHRLVVRLERLRGADPPAGRRRLREGRCLVARQLPRSQRDGHDELRRIQEPADRCSTVPGAQDAGSADPMTGVLLRTACAVLLGWWGAGIAWAATVSVQPGQDLRLPSRPPRRAT